VFPTSTVSPCTMVDFGLYRRRLFPLVFVVFVHPQLLDLKTTDGRDRTSVFVLSSTPFDPPSQQLTPSPFDVHLEISRPCEYLISVSPQGPPKNYVVFFTWPRVSLFVSATLTTSNFGSLVFPLGAQPHVNPVVEVPPLHVMVP